MIDPHFAKPEYVGAIRYNFFLETLKDLDNSLRQCGCRLYVLQGKPSEVLEKKLKVRWLESIVNYLSIFVHI